VEPKKDSATQEKLVLKWAQNLARKHRLEIYEVRTILQEFDRATEKTNGQIDFDGFGAALCKIFEHDNIKESIIASAWEATTAPERSDGALVFLDGAREATKSRDPVRGCFVQVNIDAFLVWYVANMFTGVAQLTASADMAISEHLLCQLAQHHGVSNYVLDKVKRNFDRFDLDHSGSISYDEFEAMMRNILKSKQKDDLSEDRLSRFWQEIDGDGSGGVDFAEFARWYLKYFDPDLDEALGLGLAEAFYASYSPDTQRARHNAAFGSNS